MTIRGAAAVDVAAVLEFWRRTRSEGASFRDDEKIVARLLADDPGALLLAERDGELIGTLIAAWDGWRGNMYRLAVAPEHRRQGVGLRLISEGERRLRELGAGRVSVLVWRDDPPAYGLWEAAGYDDDSGVARFVRNL